MKKTIQIVVLIMLAGLLLHPGHAAGQAFMMQNENVGKEIQDFKLKLVNGEETGLSDFRGRDKAIVFFWATWCPHCRLALKQLNEERDAIGKKGIKIALVDVGEDEPTVDKYLKKNNIAMDVFLDEDSGVATQYGLVGVPTFYFVDQKGIVKDVRHSLPKDLDKVFSGK